MLLLGAVGTSAWLFGRGSDDLPWGGGTTWQACEQAAGSADGALATELVQSCQIVEDQLLNQWVPQLASAQASGDAGAILAEYESYNARYGALLIRSDNYVFEAGRYYVIVANHCFATSTEALDWCKSMQLMGDRCLAKFITHDTTFGATVAHQVIPSGRVTGARPGPGRRRRPMWVAVGKAEASPTSSRIRAAVLTPMPGMEVRTGARERRSEGG